MDNDKWVWGDEEDSSPKGAPLLDAVLTPIAEWPGLEPEPSPPADAAEPSGKKPEELPPAAAETRAEPPEASPPEAASISAAPPRNRQIPPSVMRAIVLHLEGRVEDAIQEIKIGLRDGEPPAE